MVDNQSNTQALHRGRRCTVCDHAEIALINRIIAEGKTSDRIIANRYYLTQAAVFRHRQRHVPAYLERAIERKAAKESKSLADTVERAEALKAVVIDEFLDDIQYSKRMSKAGVERCMVGIIDPETEELKPTPLEEFRLAPGFLASFDRANTLLGQATGRLNQAPASITQNFLSVSIPRIVDQLPPADADVLDIKAIEPAS